MGERRGGIIFIKVDGVQYDAKGEFTYGIGTPKNTAVVGADGVHGFSDEVQVPFIEGEITDSFALDLAALAAIKDATATLELANGKVIVVRNAWYASEAVGNTKEGNIGFRLEGLSGEEVK